jgi:predicted ATPase
VLDNADVLQDAAATVEHMLAAMPDACIIATRRLPLGIAQERVVCVTPLPMPAPGAQQSELQLNPAVQWLLQRLPPTAAEDPDRLREIGTLVRRLDGLPLALELAAARLALSTPTELIAQLDHDLRLLDDGPADLPVRHRSITACLDLTLAAASAPARSLYLTVSAAPAVFDRSLLSEPIGERIDPAALDAALTELTLLGLIESVPAAGSGEPRWRLLQLARTHAAALACRAGIDGEARARHYDWFRRALPWLAVSGAGQFCAAHDAQLRSMLEDCEAALRFAQEQGSPDFPQWVSVLADHWLGHGALNDARRWCGAALVAAQRLPATARPSVGARLHAQLAQLELADCRVEQAVLHARAAVGEAEVAGDADLTAYAHCALAECLAAEGSWAGALGCLGMQATQSRTADRPRPATLAIRAAWLAAQAVMVAGPRHQPAAADSDADDLPPVLRRRHGFIEWLGQRRRGDWTAALVSARAGVALAHSAQTSRDLVTALLHQAESEVGAADPDAALRSMFGALDLAQRQGWAAQAALAAEMAACLLTRTGRLDAAQQLLEQYASTLLEPGRDAALREGWLLCAGLIAGARARWSELALLLMKLVIDPQLLNLAGGAVAATELGALLASATGDDERAAILLGLLDYFDQAGLWPRPLLQRRWLLDRMGAPAQVSRPARAPVEGELLRILRTTLHELALRPLTRPAAVPSMP